MASWALMRPLRRPARRCVGDGVAAAIDAAPGQEASRPRRAATAARTRREGGPVATGLPGAHWCGRPVRRAGAARNRDSTEPPPDARAELDGWRSPVLAVAARSSAAACRRASRAARCFWFWDWRRCLEGCRLVAMARDVRRGRPPGHAARSRAGPAGYSRRPWHGDGGRQRRSCSSPSLLRAACSSDDDEPAGERTTTTAGRGPGATRPSSRRWPPTSSQGRDNQTAGSVLAQDLPHRPAQRLRRAADRRAPPVPMPTGTSSRRAPTSWR